MVQMLWKQALHQEVCMVRRCLMEVMQTKQQTNFNVATTRDVAWAMQQAALLGVGVKMALQHARFDTEITL